jgi:hypothetical protein
VPFDHALELLVRRPGVEPPLDREPKHRDRGRGRLGVDDANSIAEFARGRAGALERA